MASACVNADGIIAPCHFVAIDPKSRKTPPLDRNRATKATVGKPAFGDTAHGLEIGRKAQGL